MWTFLRKNPLKDSGSETQGLWFCYIGTTEVVPSYKAFLMESFHSF